MLHVRHGRLCRDVQRGLRPGGQPLSKLRQRARRRLQREWRVRLRGRRPVRERPELLAGPLHLRRYLLQQGLL